MPLLALLRVLLLLLRVLFALNSVCVVTLADVMIASRSASVVRGQHPTCGLLRGAALCGRCHLQRRRFRQYVHRAARFFCFAIVNCCLNHGSSSLAYGFSSMLLLLWITVKNNDVLHESLSAVVESSSSTFI